MSAGTGWQLITRDPRLTPKTLSTPVALNLTNLAAWESRRRHLLSDLEDAVGPDLRREWNSVTHVLAEHRFDRFSVLNIAIETLPGYHVSANLYVPQGPGPFPGVLHPHGHWPNGRFEDTAVASVPARCINLALRGYVSLTYDMVGYGDTTQVGHRFAIDDTSAEWWGVSLMGFQVQNGLQCLDYLASLPYVDETRIACTGASAGGSQTIVLAALDERISVAAPVNMVSATCQGWCLCENAPSLRLDMSNLEIAGLIAPRPLLLVSATGDWTHATPTVEYPQLRSLYELYGVEDRIANVHVDAAHNYNMESRQAVYRWLDRWFYVEAHDEHYLEIPYPTPRREMLSCDLSDLAQADAAEVKDVLIRTAKSAGAQAAKRTETDLRDAMRRFFGVPSASRPSAVHAGETALGNVRVKRLVVRGETDHEMSVVSMLGNMTSDTTIVLACDDASVFLERYSDSVVHAARDRRIVIVEPFLSSAWQSPHGRLGRSQSFPFFTTYNRTDEAEHVRDVVRSIDFVAQTLGNRVDLLLGFGWQAPTVLFAGALRDGVNALGLELPRAAEPPEDADGHPWPWLVPGLGRAGGLEAAAKLIRSRPVRAITTDHSNAKWPTQEALRSADVRLLVHEEDAMHRFLDPYGKAAR